MTQFRPCIDLHQGKVKQLVGKSTQTNFVKENFVSSHSADYYANLYKQDNLTGGHIIQIGQNEENKNSCLKALATYPKGMQIGGGINNENAAFYLDKGADKVIITSFLFTDNTLDLNKVETLKKSIGKENIVIDLSCTKMSNDKWQIATNTWKTITEESLSQELIQELENHCAEFLIHAIDLEGRIQGIDEPLITQLSKWTTISTTYAGGIANLNDIQKIKTLSDNKIHFTVGSALDIFGGTKIKYQDCLQFS